MTDHQSWGRYPHASHRVTHLRWADDGLPDGIEAGETLLPYGNGRSYGDSCLNDGGAIVDMRGLDRFRGFDPLSGVVRCEAGVMLHDLISVVMPRGWFPAVCPGTRFVTVGGAVANDVHGKNHHRVGTFGHHVRCFELLGSDGSRRICSRDENAELFRATIGGLGLTGIIVWVELALKPLVGPKVALERIAFDALEAYFEIAVASDRTHEHTVAWVDCLARGARLGRGILFRANPIPEPFPEPGAVRGEAGPRIPYAPPFSLVSGSGMRVFNGLYHALQRARPAHATVALIPFLFPLDGIRDWNRLYGRAGFVQYQCVVPAQAAQVAIAEILRTTAASGEGSFLAVLKAFGDRPPVGPLSFPRTGFTLTLDFPQRGERTLRLLDRFDAIVADAGGALYPAKDARMAGARFRTFFPDWERLEAARDQRFSSSFWRRVTGDAA